MREQFGPRMRRVSACDAPLQRPPGRLGRLLRIAAMTAVWACASAPLATGAQPLPPPAALAVTDSLVIIQYGGAGLGLQQATDPWFRDFSGGTVGGALYTSADLAGGVFRASAEALGGLPAFPLGVQQQASASFRMSLQNTGPGAIVLPAGWLRADVDAVFGRTFGGAGQGIATHQFTSTLGGSGAGLPATGGAARLTYQVAVGPRVPPTEDLITTATAGFVTTVNSAGLGGVDGSLSFAALTLAPGSGLQVNFNLQVLAAAPSGAGWLALTDASNSAVLSMQLPAGVTLSSPVPLPWVTVVPEPAGGSLLLAGLAGLGVLARVRSLRRDRTPT